MNETPTTVDKWRAVAAATGAADRAAAEAGVRLAYAAAGLAAPERIVWAASPRAAVALVRGLTDAGVSVRDEVRTRPWAEERRSATPRPAGPTRTALGSLACGPCCFSVKECTPA
ncbi:hypothetical protein AB0E14_00005, partial [Streptomyces sp. NPDC047981]